MTQTISAYCPHNVFLLNIRGPAPDHPETIAEWINSQCSYEFVSNLQREKCPRCREIAEKVEKAGILDEPMMPVEGNLNLIGNLNQIKSL